MDSPIETIEKLNACVVACQNCGDACLNETDRLESLVACIRLTKDCAEACQTASHLLTRNSPYADQFVSLCIVLCAKCAEECEQHDMQHCIDCAKACRECEQACLTLETT